MDWTSLTNNIPPREAPLPAGTGETESMGETRLLGTDRRKAVEVEPRVCAHCHDVLGDSRPLNVSPLAGIDVFDLPDESDVLCTHDRFH